MCYRNEQRLKPYPNFTLYIAGCGFTLSLPVIIVLCVSKCLWVTHSLKRKCLHFDEIFVTGCTGSCQNDNFQCSQWLKFRQNDDIFVSVLAWYMRLVQDISVCVSQVRMLDTHLTNDWSDKYNYIGSHQHRMEWHNPHSSKDEIG